VAAVESRVQQDVRYDEVHDGEETEEVSKPVGAANHGVWRRCRCCGCRGTSCRSGTRLCPWGRVAGCGLGGQGCLQVCYSGRIKGSGVRVMLVPNNCREESDEDANHPNDDPSANWSVADIRIPFVVARRVL